jgi:hypothetical protein
MNRPTRFGVRGLVIGADGFFASKGEQLGTFALNHKVHAIFEYRAFVGAGGLMSYGGSFTDSYRMAGIYAGRILKGREAPRPAGPTIHQNRTHHQFEDRQDPWH